MDFICKRCGSVFWAVNRESTCKDCSIQLVLLDKQLKINDGRIKKLEEHKKSELKNPKSENTKTHLETMQRLEYNLQLEYKKRDGIIKMINSKASF